MFIIRIGHLQLPSVGKCLGGTHQCPFILICPIARPVRLIAIQLTAVEVEGGY